MQVQHLDTMAIAVTGMAQALAAQAVAVAGEGAGSMAAAMGGAAVQVSL